MLEGGPSFCIGHASGGRFCTHDTPKHIAAQFKMKFGDQLLGFISLRQHGRITRSKNTAAAALEQPQTNIYTHAIVAYSSGQRCTE